LSRIVRSSLRKPPFAAGPEPLWQALQCSFIPRSHGSDESVI
jgi:hypothetical protein